MSQQIEDVTNPIKQNITKYNKKRKWYERRADKGSSLGFKVKKPDVADGVTQPPFERIKKKKYAILLGYSGVNYYGMQRNPNMKTIEEELFNALLKAKYITEEGFEQMQLTYFQRAARTDKGVSAARQIVSIKLPLEIDMNQINSYLPEMIRIFGIERVTKGFDSKSNCDSRTYSYTLPTISFAEVIDESVDRTELMESYRLPQQRFEQINDTLKLFLGTQNFHNFTAKKRFYDPSAKRLIKRFECEQPFIKDNVQFATIKIRGQSFMLHQIRKMIGLVITIFRGFVDVEMIEKAWTDTHLDIPVAPGLGLVLEYVHYDRYDKRYGSDGVHKTLEWPQCEQIIEEFKKKYILSTILDTEIQKHSMLIWLETLKFHSFDKEQTVKDTNEELADNESNVGENVDKEKVILESTAL